MFDYIDVIMIAAIVISILLAVFLLSGLLLG